MEKINYLISEIEKTPLSIKRPIEKPKEVSFKSEISSQNFVNEKPPKILPPQDKEEIPFPQKLIHLPILMYHHIDYLPPNASKLWQDLTVSPETFEAQMKYLFEQNYQPITFEEFLNFLKNKKEIPEKSLIITFDDGWKNQYQNAFPVLKKYNFRATFFVVVTYIGGSALMNWKELRELIENKMEIGSHSMTHPNLKNLSESN
jgi:hypothetical protein